MGDFRNACAFPFHGLYGDNSASRLFWPIPFGRSKSRFLQSFARVLPLFSMCCISGAPSGARLSALYFGEACHDRSASTALCASCNMVSPMFIAGTLCASMLDSADLILPICIAHYISAFVLLILTLLRHTDAILSASASIAQKHDAKPSIPSLISQSIFESFSAVIGICGAIVFSWFWRAFYPQAAYSTAYSARLSADRPPILCVCLQQVCLK